MTKLLDRLVEQGDCLLWPGYTKHGYGYAKIDGKQKRVHREAYKRAYGDIPEGLTIDHLCRNKLCCNPEHLEAVTNEENLRRKTGFAYNTECRRGHSYDDAYIWNGKRYCRTCRKGGDPK